jgi:peptidoglycan/LPS O-acetylase OafA/YrhL
MEYKTKQNHKPKRRYYLDWLRVIAILLIIPFHTALIFGSGEGVHWLKDQSTFMGDLFAHFVYQWHMPLLFFLSGMSVWFALGFRLTNQYLTERFNRLIIPLVLVLVFYPLQLYFWFLTNVGFRGSFFKFYPFSFTTINYFGLGGFLGHLWFLVYLFFFSIISLPLFLYLRSGKGHQLILRLVAISKKGGMFFLFAVPLVIVEITLRAKWGNTHNLYADWANFLLFLIFFIYGYILATNSKFWDVIEQYGWFALGLGMITFLGGLIWLSGGNTNEYVAHDNISLGWFFYMTLRGFNAWLWVIAILNIGKKYLNIKNKALQYLNESSISIYILHLPVNVIVGFFVLQWNIGILLKFLVITLGTFVVTFLFYDLFIKRNNLMRFLFGMKPKNEKIFNLKKEIIK